MAGNRSCCKALPQEMVRSEIEKGRGTQGRAGFWFCPYLYIEVLFVQNCCTMQITSGSTL